MRRALSLTVSTIVAVVAIAYLCVMLPQAVGDPQDFRAFYCAGSVLATGHDPYLAVPLGRCEDRLIEAQGAKPLPGLVVPAPLPGYLLPAFVALSILPFRIALGLFSLGILAAYVIAGFTLKKLTNASSWAIAGSLGLCGVLVSLTNGQIVPFALAAICLAALALQRDRAGRAALYALGALIEPHIGIPVVLSLFVSTPRARRPLAIGGGLLALISIAVLGIGRCAEYVTRVVPAQTHSEIHSSDQYSLTALLHALGAPDATALAIGDAQYAAMLIAAIVCAHAAGRARQTRELIITLPAAFALAGGPYIHLVQMVVAVPLLLSLTKMPRLRVPAALALLLVAVPWRDIVLNDVPFAAAAIVSTTLAIAFAFVSREPFVVFCTCVAMLALGATEKALLRQHEAVRYDVSAVAFATQRPSALAEGPWRAYEESLGSYETARVYVAANAPTWLGLILMVSSTLVVCRSQARTREDSAPAASPRAA